MVKSWIHTESLWSYYIVCISVRPHGVSSDGCDDARKLHKSFCPEKPLRRGALTRKRIYTILHTETFTQRSLYTEELLQAEVFTIFYAQTLLHIEEFTHRGFDTEGPLHTDSFTHRRFYTEDFDVFARRSLYTKESFARRSLYTDEAFTQRSLYTEELLHTEGLHTRTQKLLQRSLYTEELLHTNAFTHGSFYTSLHRGAFAHKLFYTEKLLHKEVFTQRIKEELLNTEGFARRNFSTKKLLHWGAICKPLPRRWIAILHQFLTCISCERAAPSPTKFAVHHTFVRPTCAISAEDHVSQTGFWLPLLPEEKKRTWEVGVL